jgi:hypothetical protein
MIERERESGEELDMLLSSGSRRCGGDWRRHGVEAGTEEERARGVDLAAVREAVNKESWSGRVGLRTAPMSGSVRWWWQNDTAMVRV